MCVCVHACTGIDTRLSDSVYFPSISLQLIIVSIMWALNMLNTCMLTLGPEVRGKLDSNQLPRGKELYRLVVDL